jgi:hypothetical protein
LKSSKTRPNHPAARLLATGLAGLLCLGMTCSEKQSPPSLATATFTDISLRLTDPALGTPGVYLAWRYPDPGRASYFELYQSFSLDSLQKTGQVQPASADSQHALVPLPDATRPFTLYFAVRAVWVEPTGQKMVSDTLVPDSILVTPSLSILRPGPSSYQSGRVLSMEVQTNSDPGVLLRMAYFEKRGGNWAARQDTCLPLDRCDQPVFGPSVQRDSIILEQGSENDTVPALFCVIGTESFQQKRTGLAQSLTCSRFFRVHP